MSNRLSLLAILTGAVLLIAALLTVASLAGYSLVTNAVAWDRSRPVAGGLTTGGWVVVRDSTGTVARGYLLVFKDQTLISNNLTYEQVVPYAAIGKDSIELAVAGVHPVFLAFAVKISSEGDAVALSAPIPDQPEPWVLYVERVMKDSSTEDLPAELIGKWRIYGADIFDMANLIRDGDSGTLEFLWDGRAVKTLDRPPEISSGFAFPEAVSYVFLENDLIIRTESGEILDFRPHSLGDLIVLERDEGFPWILVRLGE